MAHFSVHLIQAQTPRNQLPYVKESPEVWFGRVHFQDHRFGNDPVWGPGDTRPFAIYFLQPAIDFHENFGIREKKRAEVANHLLPPGIKRFNTAEPEPISRQSTR